MSSLEALRQNPINPFIDGAGIAQVRHVYLVAGLLCEVNNGGQPVHFKGHNGQIETEEDGIVIRRKGFASKLSHAFKGEKRIPYSSISAVQFREAGLLTTGYIQFSVLGGNESRGALLTAVSDENSVLFKRGEQQEAFSKLRAMVEESIREARTPRPVTKANSVGDDLTKLADLRDRGILSEDEFAEQKARVLRQG